MAEYRKGYRVDPRTGLTQPEERAGLTREEAEAQAATGAETGTQAKAERFASRPSPGLEAPSVKGGHRTAWIVAGSMGGVLLLLIIIGIAVGGGDSGSQSSSPGNATTQVKPPPSPPPPPPPPKSTLTPAERAWFGKVGTGSQEISKAMGDIAEKSRDVATLLTDQKVRIQYAVDLGVLGACASLLEVNKAPTPRTRALVAPLRRACAHFARASSLTARGLDNLDATLIRRGAAEMSNGIVDVQRATVRVKAFEAAHSG